MANPTEDVPYFIDDFASPKDEIVSEDPDKDNLSVLVHVQKYLNKAIFLHNTLDSIDMEEKEKLTPSEQMVANKRIVLHLRNVKSFIDDKVNKLKKQKEID